MSQKLLLGGGAIAATLVAGAYFGGFLTDEPAIVHAQSSAAANAGDAAKVETSEQVSDIGSDIGSAAAFAPSSETSEGRVLGDVVLGDPNAPVTIVEYASLTCPHCATFHNGALPELKEKYIDSGKAKMIVREIYFDQFGLLAAAVARCGGEDKYHKFLDVLFKQQRDWSAGGAPAEISARLRRIGLLGGLTPERVDACMTDQDYHRTLVERFQETSQADNVRSTPYFLVNGEPVRGAVSASEMAQVIDRQL